MTASISPVPDPLDRVADDWDVLLRAVTTKLRLLVGDPSAAPDVLAPLRAGVLECAAALDQILLLIQEQWAAPGAHRHGEAAPGAT